MSSAGTEPHPDRGRVWVVIGSGFIGSTLATHLAEAGLDVRQVAAPRLSAAPGRTADALAEEAAAHPAVQAVASQLRDADCVVLAAGLAQPDARPSPALTGANALLPGVVAVAARQQSVRRFVHLSSAAVQGRTRVLTESSDVAPFSAYSRSKALGEAVVARLGTGPLSSVLVRATSVQGPGRPTTASLRQVAGSRLASVAGPGTQPSAVSSVGGLCRFVHHVGSYGGPVPLVVLQPWEGLSVTEVLTLSGGRRPRRIPRWLGTAAVGLGYGASRVLGGQLDGITRRVEAMWFGQVVEATWAARSGYRPDPTAGDLAVLLSGPVDGRPGPASSDRDRVIPGRM